MDQSLNTLQAHPHFAPLIKKHGPPDLRRGKNHFQALVSSIIHQQLSGKAAGTIFKRFRALYGKAFPKSKVVARTPLAKLRGVGLSQQKATYILDLAQKFSDGTIKHRALARLSNDEIITHLTQVKGIGVWTVHMFLIFTLNRLDILPTGDLGIRKGFQIVYNLKSLPSPRTMERLARQWRAHASIASWYLWKAADGEQS